MVMESIAADASAQYLRVEGQAVFAGWHYLLDVYGGQCLEDEIWLTKIMKQAAEQAGATILHTHMHHFGPEQGVSGVIVLAESHISVHSWPERQYAAFDVFMCGQTEPMIAIEVLKQHCQAERYELKRIQRGLGL
jgi:S-adenosylmethionine decarboxylase